MYFHGPVHASGPPENESSYQQLSLLATSKDGLQFEARAERLGNPYFRVFKWNDAWYALGMPGTFYRSADALQGFVEGPTLFTSAMRHSAVRVDGTTLQVFHTVVGEKLRDPAIFVEAGRTYLLYSVAGESGIAIGELHLP
jgi:hypothetical protein